MPCYQLTNRTSGLDLGIYEAPTAYDAIEAMHRDAGYADTHAAAAALGVTARALVSDLVCTLVLFDPCAIIAEEGMDFAARGPVGSLTVTSFGCLADDQAWEPADLSSADAFRAQVRRWREAMA